MGSVVLTNNHYHNMKFVIVALLIAAVAADVPAYPKAAYPAAYPKSYDYAPMPYNFAYAVNDAPSYNDFGHQESSDGKVVSGSYNVVLPDGRTQTYTVDDYSGYVAKVAYSGE